MSKRGFAWTAEMFRFRAATAMNTYECMHDIPLSDLTLNPNDTIEYLGMEFVKVMCTIEGSKSTFAFIAKDNWATLQKNPNATKFALVHKGDIFMPKTANVPSPGSRGNIWSKDGGIEALSREGTHIRYSKDTGYLGNHRK